MTRPAVLVLALLLASTALLRTPGAVAQGDCVSLEDFGGAAPGQFPSGWQVRKDEGREVYTVGEEPGRRFLRAVSRGLGIQAAREVKGWDLGARPVLTWSWRPRHFPRDADERESSRNDSVLAVYLLVEHSRIRGPKAVKYVWSARVPSGTRLTSNYGLTHVRVLQTGMPTGDGWVEERVNVLEDFRRAFDEKGTPEPAGIGVLTDADDTSSVAAGDYANFRACSAAGVSASPRTGR